MARQPRNTPSAADEPAEAPLSDLDVVATSRGYYGHLREVGAEFKLADPAHFSSRWMRRKVQAEPANDQT